MKPNTPEGWYPDSKSSPEVKRERYWDGTDWVNFIRQTPSDDVQDAPPGQVSNTIQDATTPADDVPTDPQPATPKRWQKLRAIGVVACIAVALIVSVSAAATENERIPLVNTSNDAPAASNDVIGCDRTSLEEVVLELINNTTMTSNYSVTISLVDDDGTYVGESVMFFSSVRPGEQVIEQRYTIERTGSACYVADVSRFANDPARPAEVSHVGSCDIVGEDILGFTDAVVSATNASGWTADLSVEIALVDSDGVRRGSGDAFIESVGPSKTESTSMFSASAFDPGLRCEVLSIEDYG